MQASQTGVRLVTRVSPHSGHWSLYKMEVMLRTASNNHTKE